MQAAVIDLPAFLDGSGDEEAPADVPGGDDVPGGHDAESIDTADSSSPRWSLPKTACLRVVHRLMGTNGEQTLTVKYTYPFRVVGVFSLTASLLWLAHFLLEVLPASTQASRGACRLSDDQLRQNALVLSAYFVCFIFVRLCMFFPGVAARVAHIQMGNQGAWRMYALHMVLHGPLYIFGIGSMLFAFQVLISPKCEDVPEARVLHRALGWYANSSCGVFGLCLVLAFFHSRLLKESARLHEEEKRKAPKGALEHLLSYVFKEHKELFGDDDDKYFTECPICLSEWDDDDIIIVLNCGHCFHRHCIACWFDSERTCAFCRQDVVDCPGRSSSTSSRQAADSIALPSHVPPTGPPVPYALSSSSALGSQVTGDMTTPEAAGRSPLPLGGSAVPPRHIFSI